MKKTVLFLLFYTLAFSLSAQVNGSGRPSILILYSYHPGNDWEDSVHHALMDELKKNLPGARLHVEYLDTKRFDPSSREETNLRLLEKYDEQPLSLIVAVDDNALAFLAGPASGFRPRLPVVFCGVGDYDSLKDGIRRPHTGVVSRINLAGTLDLAYRLVPGLKRVYVVADSTPTGRGAERMVREQSGDLRGSLASLDFEYCDSDALSTDELLHKSADLDSDTLMLFVIWSRDGRGEYISEKEFLARLKARSSVPVFNLMHKRTGLLGGRVSSGETQASLAVRKIRDILGGIPVASIPVTDRDTTSYVVDAERLVFWKLDRKALPAGTELLGELPEETEGPLRFIAVGAAGLSLLLALALVLLLSIYRRSVRTLRGIENARAVLSETIEEAFVSADAAGRILILNPAAARLSGLTQNDASGRALAEVLALEAHGRGGGDAHPVEQVLKGERDAFSCESMVLVRPDGKRIPIEASAVPLTSHAGGAPAEGVFFLFRDVSHVEKMQEILHNEQRRLRDAQAMAMIGNWEYNPEAGEYWYSREVYTLTKTDPARQPPPGILDFMKRFLPDWHHGDPLPASLLNGDYGLKSLVTVPGRDGGNSILHLMARMARNPDNGGMIVTGILQDFSELMEAKAALKLSQEQLRQAARMEAVGKLAGGIAHEFNNLLQIILGYGQLLADEVDEKLLQTYVEPILNTAGSARNLTRQLLLFSRKENLDMKPTALSSLVKGLAPLLSRLIGEDIQLEYDLECERDWVVVDRHQIEQVIINLCLNARDAMPGGGMLHLSQDNRSFVLPQPGVDGLIPSGAYVHLCVSDSGTGIGEDILPQIFDPFFTTKQQEKGTGLGLSLVYGIIRQHKGFLNVETDRNKGTSFHIYLPREELLPAKADELMDQPGVERLDGGIVYMAEDDPMVRQLTEIMLRNSGFHIESFVSGKELVGRLDEGRIGNIDLFLLDVIMPDMGGVEAFHKLRSMGYDRPVLFMSGYTEEKLRNLKDLENASLIRKPFTMKDLVGRIREMINSTP